MKLIVISLDKTNRLNPGTTECIEAFRPSVVTYTEFVRTLSMENKIEAIAKDLPDSASDDAFYKFYVESNKKTDLAVKAFVAAINGNPTGDLDNEKAAEAAADKAAKAATTGAK